MFFAGIISAEWSYEADDEDEEMKLFIEEQMDPIRRHILSTGALGCFDFGWQPYEKVFDVDTANTRIVLKKLKPLLQDNVVIKTNPDDGSFEGIETGQVLLPLEKSLLLNFDVEGTNWEGSSTLQNAEQPYDSSVVLEDAVRKYDKKMAGAHWIIKYPDTTSIYQGVERHNSEIADKMLAALTASGSVAMPIGLAQFQDVTQQGGWDIQLLTASGATVDFTNRYEYLDKQKCRALGFPERALLEGLHGTKAEAGEHKDFVISLIEYRHDCLLEQINWHLVNQLLRLNFGEDAENRVAIHAAPLDDASRATLHAVYDKILSSAEGMLRESELLDVQQIAETLSIPRKEEEDDGSIDQLLQVVST